MRSFYMPFLVLLATVLGACTQSEKSALGAPMSIEIPAVTRVEGPRFANGPHGKPVLSWMEPGETGTTLKYSVMTAGKFARVFDVVTESNMFVNWADLPSVSALNEDHWIAHWLRYSAAKTYAYDVVVSQSFDGGETWSEAVTVHTDGTPSEHGFVSMTPSEDGTALLWLDGRYTPEASMTLRSAVVTRDGHIQQEQEVDDSVCDCCQTDIAVSSLGPLAVYRDRSPEEIRDIYIARHDGQRWRDGERLFEDNWKIPGCPVNGPSIIADGNFVAVAWFSAANDQPVVRVVISTDGGKHFESPVEIASGKVFGYVGLAQLDDHNVAVSWVGETSGGVSPVYLRTVDIAGNRGEPIKVGTTRQLRVLPQLAVSDDTVIIIWTDDVDGGRTMRAAAIPWHTT